jgi:hypothetical protein
MDEDAWLVVEKFGNWLVVVVSLAALALLFCNFIA